MNIRTLMRSFGGGEVTPEFWGRIDDVKYQTGLATCRNFIPLPHGPIQNRPGTRFIREVKDSTKATRLIPFAFSTTQTFAIELGAGYFRFHTQGGTVLAGSPAAYKASATVTITIATPGVITWTGHGLANGTKVAFTTTGALPSGITAGTTYYVVNAAANTFEIAATAGGTSINTTGTQSGVHTGSLVYSIGDLISSGGTNYYCILGHYNQTPPNATYWYPLPSAAYEIPNPYAEADLFDIHYVQSGDVLTLVHPSYAPRELRRYAATNWQTSTISFSATLSGPASVTATTTGGGTNPVDFYTYKITALDSNEQESSATASTPTGVINLGNAGAKIDLSWSAVTGAIAYNVYKATSYGSYGYIGQTTSTSFRDTNIIEDLGKQPPQNNNPFSTDFPGAVSYFEQRRAFAGTPLKPQNIWMTRSGTESNLSFSTPSRDDDSIQFAVAARELNVIRHIVPLNNLMLLTSSAEWRVTSVNSDALTPTSISVRPQSYIGASNAQPIIVNNNLIFGAARGGHVRELAYNWQASGYITGDLSLRAPHLFDGYEIKDMAYAKSPQPVVWFVSTNGKLLGLTYVPEQAVGAWHQHDTDGSFESVTVVTEGAEDAIYVIVRRTIGGNTKRFVERFSPRAFSTQSDAYFVDCGLSYSGSPATVFSGLSHLEGKTVSILADGAVHPQRVVTSGQVTLEQAASTVHIGLPFQSDAKTLPLAFETQAYGQGREKNVNCIWLRVYRSSGIFAGPDENNLTEAKQRTTEPYGSPPALKSEEIRLVISPSWRDSGQVFIRQSDPLPLTIVSMTLEVAIGS